jgi:hypothetical protein
MHSLNGSRASAIGRLWQKALSAFRSYGDSLFARGPRAGVRSDGRKPMRYTSEADLPAITDEEFARVRASLRSCTVVVLKAGPRFEPPDPEFTSDVAKIVWAHGRRNAVLRVAGLMPIVCPVADGSGVTGIAILDTDAEEAHAIMSADPGVRSGVFTYDIHPARSIPGSTLR